MEHTAAVINAVVVESQMEPSNKEVCFTTDLVCRKHGKTWKYIVATSFDLWKYPPNYSRVWTEGEVCEECIISAQVSGVTTMPKN